MTASNGQHIETALPVSMRRRLATTTDGNGNRQRRPRYKAASTGRRGRRANTDSGAMSPSAVSSCSLASIATTSSGLSSAASNSSISSSNGSGKELPLPVVTPSESPSTDKSTSSSSAASSAGFCDIASSAGDVDEFDLEYIDPTVNLIHFIDQTTAFTDARVWVNNAPSSRGSGSKCKRSNKRGCPSGHGNLPNLSNPAVHQFFNEQRRFYRQIYDQQFSVLSSISKAKADPKSVTFETPKMVTYAPHQHLGLPPMPPPPATSAPWMYPNYQSFIAAQPLPEEASPCEEAFLQRLEEHRVPTKALREVMSRSRVRDIKVPTTLDLAAPTMESEAASNDVEETNDTTPSDEEKTSVTCSQTSEESNICSSKISDEECRAARADFHRQIRERLLGVTKPNSATSTAPTTPVSPSPSPVTQYPVSPSPSNASVTSSYATILTKNQPSSPPASSPQPLNRVTVSPPPHLPLSAMDAASTVSSSSSSSVSSLATTKSSRRNHRTSKKKAAAAAAGSKVSTTPVKEFNIGEEDFPPIGDKSLSPMLEAVVSKAMPIPSPRGESGYHSENSPQSAIDVTEVESRISDSTYNRDYSAAVVNGTVPPVDNSDICRLDRLSDSICEYYEQVAQTEKTLLRKLRLRDLLFYTLSPLFPVCGLYVVGSSLNGFGNEHSDMDLCLVISNRDLDQKTDAVNLLRIVEQALAHLPLVAEQKLITAKVPILRIKFRGAFENVTVDLNANNSVAIKNTHLLCYYAFFDWRLRPLVAIVKEWAKRCDINDASRSSFTSYSLVLMVIHYLQCGIDTPVLPSLQSMFPRRFSSKNDIRMLNVSLPLERVPENSNFRGNNDTTLGELLIGFFQYYAKTYEFEKSAISVRLGRRVDRSTVARIGCQQWSHVFIEEPFTLQNTAHSIYEERVFTAIKNKFDEAHRILTDTYDINQLLSMKPHNVSTSMPGLR